MHGSESWSVMPAIPLSTPVHPRGRTPGSTERAICAPRQADTYPQGQCKGRAHEQINTWFTDCNTFHGGDASASADHGERGGYVNCAIEELELAAEQEMHSWEITHAKHKK